MNILRIVLFVMVGFLLIEAKRKHGKGRKGRKGRNQEFYSEIPMHIVFIFDYVF